MEISIPICLLIWNFMKKFQFLRHLVRENPFPPNATGPKIISRQQNHFCPRVKMVFPNATSPKILYWRQNWAEMEKINKHFPEILFEECLLVPCGSAVANFLFPITNKHSWNNNSGKIDKISCINLTGKFLCFKNSNGYVFLFDLH